MRLLIEDGPHRGVIVWPDTPSTLDLAEPGSGLRPATRQRYARPPSAPGDFVRGWDARYQWEPTP